jgi:hypothetical protein
LRFSPTVFVVSATLLALCACGSGGNSRNRDRDSGIAIAGVDGRVSIIRPGPDANAAYSEGLDLKNQGDCANAILKLRPVASLGLGYENAQTALGSCLVATPAKTKDELSSEYLEGLTWLRRAGDAGWPEAQAALASVHAFGPAVIRNGEEAAYWLVLYETNPNKSRLGFTPISVTDLAALQKAVTPEQRAAGSTRAAQWERKVWIPAAPAGRGPERGSDGRERRRQSPS